MGPNTNTITITLQKYHQHSLRSIGVCNSCLNAPNSQQETFYQSCSEGWVVSKYMNNLRKKKKKIKQIAPLESLMHRAKVKLVHRREICTCAPKMQWTQNEQKTPHNSCTWKTIILELRSGHPTKSKNLWTLPVIIC